MRRSGRPRVRPLGPVQERSELLERPGPPSDEQHRSNDDADHMSKERVRLDREHELIAANMTAGS